MLVSSLDRLLDVLWDWRKVWLLAQNFRDEVSRHCHPTTSDESIPLPRFLFVLSRFVLSPIVLSPMLEAYRF